MKMSRILVPTDFSAGSDHALRLAISMARKDLGSITLMHVAPFPPTVVGDVYGPMPMLDVEPVIAQIAAESRHLVARQAAQEIPSDVPWTPLVVMGFPADEISAQLERGGYDLVVMGTHGRRGLTHLFLGSVAERVLRHSPVPVLVTR